MCSPRQDELPAGTPPHGQHHRQYKPQGDTNEANCRCHDEDQCVTRYPIFKRSNPMFVCMATADSRETAPGPNRSRVDPCGVLART
jgi:hypothetical protein